MNEEKFTVLIVDDNTNNLQVLSEVLDSCGYEIGFAMNGRQAIDYVKMEKPDLILLDVMMPDIDGFETCGILKKDPEFMDIPIIFLTAKVETEDIVKGFEVGGVDYISKPFHSAELKSRVKTHLELKRAQDALLKSFDELREAKNYIELQNEMLNRMMKELDDYSKKDPLTGLANRRSMIEAMENEKKLYEKNNKNFSIVMGDVDYFKEVNDVLGHDYGDYVLKALSDIFQKSIRKSDWVSRWGGEEFLFMLTGVNAKAAAEIIKKMLKTINDYTFVFNGKEKKITMTFGVSENVAGCTIDEIIKRADNALLKGKNTGKNTVVLA